MRILVLFAGIGAALAYFFDPQSGRRRRALLRDRTLGFVRHRARDASQLGTVASAHAYGVKQKALHLREEPKDFDDQTLKSKVETELFRPADAPKGTVNVNVENGVVYLRGEADTPEMIRDLVERTERVQGVRQVKNLLHLPGTPAPTKD